MPFYSPQPLRDKRREAQTHADVLGIPETKIMSTTPQFSPEEIEKFRSIVLDSDKKSGGVNVFDPNRPPHIPYKHQEFPKVLYNHEESRPSRDKIVVQHGGEHLHHIPAKYVTLVVNNEKELNKALKDGWKEKAPDLAAKHQGINPDEEVEVIPEAEGEAGE